MFAKSKYFKDAFPKKKKKKIVCVPESSIYFLKWLWQYNSKFRKKKLNIGKGDLDFMQNSKNMMCQWRGANKILQRIVVTVLEEAFSSQKCHFCRRTC